MKKLNNEVMLGAFILGAGGLLAYMSIAVGGFNMAPGVHVTAKFSNASGVVKDASVSIAGVEVGHVESLQVEHDKAVVKLFLNKDAHVRSDVVAAVRAKSLLGEKYIELQPQSTTAAELKDGDVIGVTRATVEVDELLAALGPVIKQVDPKDVATIVRTVAKTMEDEQGSLAAVIQNAAQISQQVNDTLAANRKNIDQIATNTAGLTTQGNELLKAKRPEIERTVTQIDKLTGTLQSEAPGLVKQAKHIASNVDHMTSELKGQTPAISRAIANADKTMVKLPGTLDGLNSLQKDVTQTLNKTNPLLDKANAFDTAKFKELTENIMLKTGINVHMSPFGRTPTENDWQKKPQAQ
jgi:phospholipid/cholesterol/gamma-HCH transport system substrate-binding protein